MTIVAVGVNYKTAPVEIREKVAFPLDLIPNSLKILRSITDVSEAIILSTCNRSEIYVVGQNLPKRDEPILSFLQRTFNISQDESLPYLYRYHEERAVRHLFNVASGIDSMVIGEAQILGQVKQAIQIAEKHETAGSVLHRLFRSAIEVGKRGRNESSIGENSSSVSHAAILLAKRIFASLEDRTALVIGAGDTGRLTVKCLSKEGLKNIYVASRNIERAEKLAEEFNGNVIPYDKIYEHLWKADIVISSTSAPHLVLPHKTVQHAITRRRNAPMFLIDLAMPRDIDPTVNRIENVYLYDLDDLEETVAKENKERETAIAKVKQFIEEELVSFFTWYHSLGAVPIIKALREQVEEIRQVETGKFLLKFPHLSLKERAALEALTKGIINKVVHRPLVQLKEYANEPEGWKHIETVKALFGLTTFDFKENDASG